MEQLRRQLRAELLQEFMLPQAGRLPTTTLAFEELPASPRTEPGIVFYRASALSICRPYRLVIGEGRERWDVVRVQVGLQPVLPSSMPVTGQAFTPLPAFLDALHSDGNEGLRHKIAQLLDDAPISNITPYSTMPGVIVEVALRRRAPGRDDARAPAVWMLAHVPND